MRHIAKLVAVTLAGLVLLPAWPEIADSEAWMHDSTVLTMASDEEKAQSEEESKKARQAVSVDLEQKLLEINELQAVLKSREEKLD